jgi:hypothetical protein
MPSYTIKSQSGQPVTIQAASQDEALDKFLGSSAAPDVSEMGSFGRGLTSMLPMGNQAYSAVAGAAQNEPYMQERQELEKETQEDKDTNPVARVAGQAAGVVAPALLTGGSSVPATLGEAAGQGALVGGGFGAGNAIDTLASGGSGMKAAGDVALGAGLGAAGGAIGQKLAGAAEDAIPSIENYAGKKAFQGVGLEPKLAGRMGEQESIDTGKMLVAKGIVVPGATKQSMFDKADGLLSTAGEKIGQIGDRADELGLTTDTKPMLDAIGEKYNQVSQLADRDARRAANDYKSAMVNIQTMANRNGAERVAPDILTDQPSSFITFNQLKDLKQHYGGSAFENGGVKNQAAADVYSQLGAGQKAITDKAITNPNLPDEFKTAMADYSSLHPVVEGLRDLLGRERTGTLPAKGFGMLGKLAAQLPGQDKPIMNALTAAGLMIAGHPLGALGVSTATLANPVAMSGIATGAARAIPGIAAKLPMAGAQLGGAASAQNMGEVKPVRSNANMSTPNAPTSLNVNHPALAPWKQTFTKNAATAKDAGEIQKSQAVTDFILSQRDPAYAAAKQKATDTPVAQESSQNPAKMAEGGIVANNPDFGKPVPGFTSTLPGLAEQMKHPTHEAPPPAADTLPTRTTQQFHQPFNTDMEDKLKAFLSAKEDDDAQSR